MATVISDCIEDATVLDTPNHVEIRRTFIVYEITGDPAYAVLPNALNAAGIPVALQPHPFVTLATCQRREVYPKGTNQAKVVCTYIWDRFISGIGNIFTWSIGTSLCNEEANIDNTGALVKIPYTAGGVALQIPADPFSYPRPLTVFTASRRQDVAPNSLLVGSVNSQTWAGGTAHTWLLAAVYGNGASFDGVNLPTKWDVSYQFQYKSTGWDILLFQRSPVDGKPVTDIAAVTPYAAGGPNSANGWVRPLVYTDLNFTAAFGNPP
jgi:hypothetical protein